MKIRRSQQSPDCRSPHLPPDFADERRRLPHFIACVSGDHPKPNPSPSSSSALTLSNPYLLQCEQPQEARLRPPASLIRRPQQKDPHPRRRSLDPSPLRVDPKSLAPMRGQDRRVHPGNPHWLTISSNRLELTRAGSGRHSVPSPPANALMGEPTATSVIVSGGYEDDEEQAITFTRAVEGEKGRMTPDTVLIRSSEEGILLSRGGAISTSWVSIDRYPLQFDYLVRPTSNYLIMKDDGPSGCQCESDCSLCCDCI